MTLSYIWPFLFLPPFISAYSWHFTSTPYQCQNIGISIDGSGSPPYSVLIIPFGPSPLPNNVEVRRIYSQNFSGSDTSLNFQLKYPANSQFVAVVSDASGYGSGGTSVAAQVLAGSQNDTSCFNATADVSPNWFININPPNQIVQCTPTRIWWDPTTVQGTPQFVGIIPGGQSFQIPVPSQLTNVDGQGTGFSWTPSVRGGTTLIIAGGDNRGMGTGGSVLNTVSFGTNPDNSCLSGSSPSSTPGSPAGGSYPTNSAGAQTDGNGSTGSSGSNKSSNVGAIVGAVLGTLALLSITLVAFFFYRRKRDSRSVKEVPVDLLQGQEDEDPNDPSRGQLPTFYRPEPFVLPDPSVVSRPSGDQDRPLSLATSTTTAEWPLASTYLGRSPTPDASLAGAIAGLPQQSSATSASRKMGGAAQRIFRPVNIIQHDDAGPSDAPEGEAETIELPPAYTKINHSKIKISESQQREREPLAKTPPP